MLRKPKYKNQHKKTTKVFVAYSIDSEGIKSSLKTKNFKDKDIPKNFEQYCRMNLSSSPAVFLP